MIVVPTRGGFGLDARRNPSRRSCSTPASRISRPCSCSATRRSSSRRCSVRDVKVELDPQHAGDVPNLYAPEDDETITTACKQDCLRKRLQPTKLNIFACYLARVMANLHLILCFSPWEKPSEMLRMFPSLVNCSGRSTGSPSGLSVRKSMFRGVVAPSLH